MNGLLFAIIVAGLLWGVLAIGSAMGVHRTARVLVFLRGRSDWVRTRELRDRFGGGVYPLLSWLADEGLLDTRTQPGGPERGHREIREYRWRVLRGG